VKQIVKKDFHLEILDNSHKYSVDLIESVPQFIKIPSKGMPMPCTIYFHYKSSNPSQLLSLAASMTDQTPRYETSDKRALGRPTFLSVTIKQDVGRPKEPQDLFHREFIYLCMESQYDMGVVLTVKFRRDKVSEEMRKRGIGEEYSDLETIVSHKVVKPMLIK